MRQSIVVVVFPTESEAQNAAAALVENGVDRGKISTYTRGVDDSQAGLMAWAMAATDQHDVAEALVHLGMSDGEARFYAQESAAGRTLVVAEVEGHVADASRQLLIERGGYDVRSRGAELARNPGAGVAGGVAVRPLDATSRWEDVSSRYEMLWQQHYGTTDATWEEMQPVYRFAWRAANDMRNYGRPWSEVEPRLRTEWETSSATHDWSAVAGPIRDVWEDVAEEAAQGTEGAADRRITGPGTDQSIAARDLRSAP